MSSYPIKPSKDKLSLKQQNAQIVNEALSGLDVLNEGQQGSRRITPLSARKVVTRSLNSNPKDAYSIRRHKALTALSHYTVLAQKNKVVTASAENTDLLPIAHPLSTRPHAIAPQQLSVIRSRWYADDARVTDPLVSSLLASAFSSPPNSSKREYALARLSAMGSAKVPREALVAAFLLGANKGYWLRQLRDGKGRFAFMGGGLRKLVRRAGNAVNWLVGKTVSTNPDSDTFVMELPNGNLVRSKAGDSESIKAVISSQQNKDGYTKTPAKYSSSDNITDEKDLEFVDSPDGWGKNEAWQPDADDREYYGKETDLGAAFDEADGNYEVVKFDKPNAPAKDKFEAAQQKEAEGQNVVAIGNGEKGELDPDLPVYFLRRKTDDAQPFAVVQSWSEVQRLTEQDTELYEKGELPGPTRGGADEAPETELPAGTELTEDQIESLDGDFIKGNPNAPESKVKAYEKKLAEYEAEGGDFPIDPRKDYFLADDGTIVDTETGVVLRDSLGNTEDGPGEPDEAPEVEAPAEPAEDAYTPESAPEGFYEVDRGDYIPEGATDGQESENYTDDPAALAEEYSSADLTNALKEGVESNGFGFLPFDEGSEPVPAEALYKALDEKGEDADLILDSIYKAGKGDKTPDVTPDVEEQLGEDLPEAAQGEPTEKQTPPLIEGLTEDEQQAFLESGNYEQYLPKNETYTDAQVPEGYYNIDPDPFTPIETDIPEGAPEGFSVNPVDIANDYSSEDLEKELRRSLTPEAVNDGYGVLGMETPEGEQFVANVPAEAIRDALELQGVDTKPIIDDEYSQGLEGQTEDAITPQFINDIIKFEEADEDDLSELKPQQLKILRFVLMQEVIGPDAKTLTKQTEEEFEEKLAKIDAEILKREGQPEDIIDVSNLSDDELKERANEINEIFMSQALGPDEVNELQAENKAIYEELKARGLLGEDVEEGEVPEAPETEEQPAPEAAEPPAPPTDVPATDTGEPDGPFKATEKAKDLKTGDVTAADFFTIEEIFSDEESEALKPGSVWAVGYYPGHVTQKTKLWNANIEIDVFRNVTPPQKGDLPELSKPKPKEFDPEGNIFKDEQLGLFVPKDAEARSKFLDAVDQYNKDLETAKGLWADAPEPGSLPSWQSETAEEPFTPENPVGVVTVPASKVMPGDITFKKEKGNDFFEYFIVQSVEEVDGKAVLKGFYPNHASQDKEWNATTEITVMRGATELPEPGNLPALNRPAKGDPEFVEKKAAFNEAKKASAETFTPPINPEGTEEKKPKTSKPSAPVFKGDKLNQLLQQAAGDPAEFMNLLKNEKLIFIDFETTGQSFASPNPIQVAYNIVENGQSVATGTQWMNPEEPLAGFYTDKDPADILKDPSGKPISDDFLSKQQSLEEGMAKIFDLIDEDTIVIAHSIPFDEKILIKYSNLFGIDYTPAGTIDTLSLARKVMNAGPKAHELAKVAARYGIVPEGDYHDAVTDVEVLEPILFNLLGEMNITKQGIEVLNFEEQLTESQQATQAYEAEQEAKKKADTSLLISKTVADAFDGDQNLPEVEEIVDAVPQELPSSEEQTVATTPTPNEISDGSEETESVFGDVISDNWVEDDGNTTDLGEILLEDVKVGDFIPGKYGGWMEILEITPDPDDDARVFVRRKLVSSGKEYPASNSWVKFQPYQVRRRNTDITEPVTEESKPQIDTEATAEKWQGYDIKQDSAGVFYAESISAGDVQKLRNGELTPPQLPFFAPMGGGKYDEKKGDGYFFSSNGKRFWGKFGAAGALVRRKNSDNEYEYFLAKRSAGLSQGGGKWGYPGGALKDSDATSLQTAVDEFKEEVGGDIFEEQLQGENVNQVAPDWNYNTFIFEVGPEELNDLKPTDGENSEVGFFTAEQIQKMADDGLLQDDFALNASNILGEALDSADEKDVDVPEANEVSSVGLGTVYDTSNWKKVAGQAGTAAGGFYVDPETGQQYYVKSPKGGDMQAVNEVLASALYEAAGLDVGRAFLGKNKKGENVIVSPVIDGTDGTLGQIAPNQNILNEIKKGFAVDAWMNNYDVIGLDKDNIIVAGMKPYRIDAGGALLFRAQGKSKAEEMNTNVSEQIDSLRDPDQNAQAASVFGDMTDAEIAESAKLVEAIDEEKIDELVDAAFASGLADVNSSTIADKLKENLKRRRKELIDQYNVEESPEPQTAETPEPEAPESQEAPEADAPSAPKKVLNISEDIEPQIEEAIANGEQIVFSYNGKTIVLDPEEVKTAKSTGNVNLVGTYPNGNYGTFTLSKMEQADSPEIPEGQEQSKAGFEDIPEASTPEEAEKPTEISPDVKDELLKTVEAVATAMFGEPDPEKVLNILENLKGVGGNDPEVIDSIITDLTTPKPEPKETPEEKIADDLDQLLTPDEEEVPEGVEPIDLDALAQELANPTNPDLIWAKVKEDYEASILDNGHIVVDSVKHGNKRFDVVVKRNSDNTFSIYTRITDEETGDTKVRTLKGNWHSFTALESRINTERLKVATNPNLVLGKSKKEAVGTIEPQMPPKQEESYVSADGKTVLAVGMEVIYQKTGEKGVVTSLTPTYTVKNNKTGKIYTYTDKVKVKFPGKKANNYISNNFLPVGSELPPTPDTDSDGGGSPDGGGTPTPEPTPQTPAPAAPEPETETAPEAAPEVPTVDGVDLPTYSGPSMAGAETIEQIELNAVDKNSPQHLNAFGASTYSDYKEFLKGKFVKDQNSGSGKNMASGILIQNADPNAPDQDLTSYGVVTSTNPPENSVNVTFVSGPLKGESQTLTNQEVWSREKFISPQQAEELGASLDDALFAEAKQKAFDKGKEYIENQKKAAKAAEEKAALEKAEKEEKAKKDALKSQFVENGPGFAVQTADLTEVDWSSSPNENVPSLAAALQVAKSDDPLSAGNGSTALVDADAIEDLEIRIQKVTGKGQKEQIRLSFVLTDWVANKATADFQKNDNIKQSDGLDLDKYEVQEDGSLLRMQKWGKTSVDGYGKGTTFSGKAGKGTFKLHRATKSDSPPDFFKHGSSSDSPVSFHNKAEIYLPANATEADIQKALEDFGAINSVRPASQQDIKGLVENKMIWLYGSETDGKKNFSGDLRQQQLDFIKNNYGFTADDVEISVDEGGYGRINYLVPESVAQKIVDGSDLTHFHHNWTGDSLPPGDNARADYIYKLFASGGLFATANRWMNGINSSGMSSKTDIRAAGGNYVFTHPTNNNSNGSSSGLRFYFDGVKLLRRMDWYKNNNDKYGQLGSEAENNISKLSSGGGEVMFKKNLSWADLSGIDIDSDVRKILIEKLTAEDNVVPNAPQLIKILEEGIN